MVQDSTYLSDDPASGSEFFKLAMDVLQPTTKTEMETYVEFLRQLSDKIWKKWDENSKRNSSDVDALCDLLSKVDMSRDEIDIRRERAAIGGPLVRRQDIQATGIVVNERPVEVNSSIRLIGGVDEKVDEVVQAMNSLVLIDNVNRVEGIAVANNLRPSINQEEQMHTSSGLWAPTQANFSMYNGAHDNGNTAWAVSSADADSDDDTSRLETTGTSTPSTSTSRTGTILGGYAMIPWMSTTKTWKWRMLGLRRRMSRCPAWYVSLRRHCSLSTTDIIFPIGS